MWHLARRRTVGEFRSGANHDTGKLDGVCKIAFSPEYRQVIENESVFVIKMENASESVFGND